MHDEVTMEMGAPPMRVWELLSDVTRIGELSPETFEAEWVGGATAPAVGARFRGHVKRNGRGPVYWSDCVVTECEPGRSFGFSVEFRGRVANTWAYRIAPVADPGRCAVTESFRLPDNPQSRIYWALFGRWRGKTNRDGMRATLTRAKAIVEAA